MVPSGRGAPGAFGFLDGSKASPRLRWVLRTTRADEYSADAYLAVAGRAMVPSGRGAPGAFGFLDGSKASPRRVRLGVTDASDCERSATGAAAWSAAISSPMRSGCQPTLGTLSADFDPEYATLSETSAIPELISVLAASGRGFVFPRPATSSVFRLCEARIPPRSACWSWTSSVVFSVEWPGSAPCLLTS